VLSGAGVLEVTNTSGITFLNATANGQTTLDFQGTLAAINEALDGLQFVPADEYVGPAQIAFFTSDHGNTGVGPAPTYAPGPVSLFSQEQDVRLEVLTVTDAPTIDVTKTLSLTSINETPSSPPVPAVPAPNSGQSVYSVLTNAGATLPAMTLTATGAKYGIAITSATIVGQLAGAPGGVWQYSLDGGNTWLNMTGLAPNNALLLDGGNGTSTFGNLVRFLPAANFNSSDGTPTITFNGWDQTAALNPSTNALVPLAAGSFADLTASGIGTGGSTPFSPQSTTATITVNAVNDRPTVTAPSSSFTTKESTTIPLAGISVTDFEFSQNNGTVKVTIGLSDPTTGTLSASFVSGLTGSGNNTASLTLQGTLAVVNQALATLTFTPAAHFAGSTQVNIQAQDFDTSGLPVDGSGVSINQVSAPVAVSVLVTAVHQAPVLYPTGDGVSPVSGNPTLAPVAENASSSSNLGTSVQSLLASFGANSIYQDGKSPVNTVPQPAPFLDLDVDAGAKEGIAIDNLVTPSNSGFWQYSVNGGVSWVTIGTANDNNALVLPGSALVRFQPNQNYVSSPGSLPSFTFRAWDQTDAASPATRVNLTPLATKTGGTTAYSATTATATVTVAAQNQPPSFAISSGYSTFMDNTVAASSSQHGRNNLPISVPNFVFSISPGLQGESVTLQVTNDDPSLFTASGQPTITLDPSGTTGTLHFTLAPDQFGVATLTVTAVNSGGGNNTSAPKTATITVIGITDPPTIDSVANQQVANNAGMQQLALTGITPGLDETQVMSVTATSDNPNLIPNPTISYTNPNTTGTLFYTPTPGMTGTATITLTVTNNGGTAYGGVPTYKETFTITVVSGTPTANAATVTVAENSPQLITLTGSPATNQSYALSATIATLPTNGTLYQTPDGTTLGAPITTANTLVTNTQNEVIYVPKNNQTGNDSFTFTMTGGSPAQTSLPATIGLNVLAPSQLPSFTPGANVQVGVNSGPQTIAGWATNISSGTNPSGQTLVFVLTGDTNPSLFSVAPAVNASNGTLSFTPTANDTGSATITFVLRDPGNGQQSAAQSFNINVNSVPVAQADTYVLSSSGTNTVSAANGVLSNDSAGAGVTAQLVSQPSRGTLVFHADGSFSYTPNASFQGYDQFSYRAVNGGAAGNAVTVTLLSHQAAVVDKLYHQVLGRSADLVGLQYWTNLVTQGQPYGIIAQGIFDSDERLMPIVSEYYQQFLLRTPDSAGLAYWVHLWQQDGGPENVVAGMISSPEFFAQAGLAHPDKSPNEAWVTTLYERLLNREPDTQGLNFWTNNLNTGAMTRQQVVLGFETSHEAYTNDVTSFYQLYLNRNPSPSEAAPYVAQLESGSTQADVQIEIINTTEYQNNPPLPATGTTSADNSFEL
jgi:hypothetical protein